MRYFISDSHFDHYAINNYANRPFLHMVKDNEIYHNEKLIKQCKDNEEANREAKYLTIKKQEEFMIDAWNKTVKKEDTVYFLGDFCNPARPQRITELLKKLNGTKILIKGNHDKSLNKMKEFGFDETHNYLEIKIKDEDVMLSHYPYIQPKLNRLALRRPNIIRTYKDSLPSDYQELLKLKKEIGINQNNLYELPMKDIVKYITKAVSYNLHIKKKKEKQEYNFIKKIISTFIGSRITNQGKILIHGHTHSYEKVHYNMINVCTEVRKFIPVSEDEIYKEILDIRRTQDEMILNPNAIPKYYVDVFYNSKTEDIHIIKLAQLHSAYACYKNKTKLSLPKNPQKEWFDFVYKHNMMIAKKDLVDDQLYKGSCRNAEYALWSNGKFYYVRSKFNCRFVEEISHPEDENIFDVFVPYSVSNNEIIKEILEKK